MAVHCHFGNMQEPAALYALSRQLGTGGRLTEVGLCPLDPQRVPKGWGFGCDELPLPPVGASPDAMLVVERLDPPGQPLGALESALLQLCAGPSAVLADLAARGPSKRSRRRKNDTSKAGGGGDGGNVGDSGGGGGDMGAFAEPCRFPCPLVGSRPGVLALPVEVKSRSPFREVRTGRGRGRRYGLRDVSPDETVPARDVPQMQLHALCTGAPGCIYMCHTAGQGSRAWFVRSDPVYQRQMLQLFSLLLRDFVRTGQAPPTDVWFAARYRSVLDGPGGAGYPGFLRRTRTIAARAVPLFSAEPAVFPGLERSPPFLPGRASD